MFDLSDIKRLGDINVATMLTREDATGLAIGGGIMLIEGRDSMVLGIKPDFEKHTVSFAIFAPDMPLKAVPVVLTFEQLAGVSCFIAGLSEALVDLIKSFETTVEEMQDEDDMVAGADH